MKAAWKTSPAPVVSRTATSNARLSINPSPPPATAEEAKALHQLTFELRRRIGSLYGDIASWAGVPTESQTAQMTYYSNAMNEIQPRVEALANVELPASP